MIDSQYCCNCSGTGGGFGLTPGSSAAVGGLGQGLIGTSFGQQTAGTNCKLLCFYFIFGGSCSL